MGKAEWSMMTSKRRKVENLCQLPYSTARTTLHSAKSTALLTAVLIVVQDVGTGSDTAGEGFPSKPVLFWCLSKLIGKKNMKEITNYACTCIVSDYVCMRIEWYIYLLTYLHVGVECFLKCVLLRSE